MLENTRGPLHGPKIIRTLVHKWLKIKPEFLPTLSSEYFVPSPAHALSGINVAPHSESKWNGIGFICSSDSKPPEDLNLAMASRRAALSVNAWLIATFSIVKQYDV